LPSSVATKSFGRNVLVADRNATRCSQLHTGCHLRASIPTVIARRSRWKRAMRTRRNGPPT
jgi:hypothetical protein